MLPKVKADKVRSTVVGAQTAAGFVIVTVGVGLTVTRLSFPKLLVP